MKQFLMAALLLGGISGFSQKDNSLSEKVLFEVGSTEVTAGEFMQVYNKNRNIGEDIDPKTPKEYLDLYINFKLKVQNAKELGMDTMPRFLNEFNSYRSQLAEPYLTDKGVNQELVKEAYNRSKYDVRASHIMMAVSPEAPAMDTVKAYQKLVNLRKRIEGGESFEEIAKAYSMDTYSAKNGGDLGYFTVFNMVYPFENAVYENEVGELANIVRTQFGYHLIKVTDKRPARGEVEVAHILLVDNNESTEAQSTNAKNKIDEIYAKLQEGAEFGTLAQQYSEDKSSAYKGGVIPEFGINKMFPEFEEVAFSLKEGEVSEPFKTPVGWHVLKVIEKKGVKPLEEVESSFKKKIDRDSRSQQGRLSVVKKLKKEYAFNESPANRKLAFKQVDESFLKLNYDAEGHKHGAKVLFSFAYEEYTISDFLNWLELNQAKVRKKAASLEAAVEKAYKQYSESKLIAYEKKNLEKKYPEFAMLSREYFEGILLFDLTEKMVWKKSVTDSAGLADFYAENKQKYQWTKRYEMVLVSAATEKIAKKARKMLKKGASISEVNVELNEESLLNVKLDTGVYELSDNELLPLLNLPDEGLSEVVEKNERFHFGYVKATMPAGPKTLKEARGVVLSDYTDYLEKQWIKELNDKYTVKVDNDVMSEVEQALENE